VKEGGRFPRRSDRESEEKKREEDENNILLQDKKPNEGKNTLSTQRGNVGKGRLSESQGGKNGLKISLLVSSVEKTEREGSLKEACSLRGWE